MKHTQSFIHELNSLNDITNYCTNDSLVIFDIDNTLITPANKAALGSDQWFQALLNHSLTSTTEAIETKQMVILFEMRYIE